MKHITTTYSLANFLSGSIFARFRLLNTQINVPDKNSYNDYYKFSTKNNYLEIHAINEFRRLFITQLPFTRKKGWKEDFFINYFDSKTFKNYLEIGYGLDGIFSVFRLEFVTSFENGKYQKNGFLLGATF